MIWRVSYVLEDLEIEDIETVDDEFLENNYPIIKKAEKFLKLNPLILKINRINEELSDKFNVTTEKELDFENYEDSTEPVEKLEEKLNRKFKKALKIYKEKLKKKKEEDEKKDAINDKLNDINKIRRKLGYSEISSSRFKDLEKDKAIKLANELLEEMQDKENKKNEKEEKHKKSGSYLSGSGYGTSYPWRYAAMNAATKNGQDYPKQINSLGKNDGTNKENENNLTSHPTNTTTVNQSEKRNYIGGQLNLLEESRRRGVSIRSLIKGSPSISSNVFRMPGETLETTFKPNGFQPINKIEENTKSFKPNGFQPINNNNKIEEENIKPFKPTELFSENSWKPSKNYNDIPVKTITTPKFVFSKDSNQNLFDNKRMLSNSNIFSRKDFVEKKKTDSKEINKIVPKRGGKNRALRYKTGKARKHPIKTDETMNIDNNSSKKFDKKPLIGRSQNENISRTNSFLPSYLKQNNNREDTFDIDGSSFNNDIEISKLKTENKFKQNPLRVKPANHETKLIQIQPKGTLNDFDETPSTISNTLELRTKLKK